MTPKLTRAVLQHVFSQVEKDAPGLAALQPAIQWKERIGRSVNLFVPRLIKVAPALIQEVPLILNSSQNIRQTWLQIKDYLQKQGGLAGIEQEAAFLESELARESNLLTVVTGDMVSNLISNFLCAAFPGLRKNNRSTYPDLYFGAADYSQLPRRRRGQAVGPALKGGKPTSVPDGIEIKSQRGKGIRVDCHHDHQGLHLVMTYNQETDAWVAYDLYLAYLSKADYRRASRNTTATTEKFSFGHAPFISVTRGIVRKADLIKA